MGTITLEDVDGCCWGCACCAALNALLGIAADWPSLCGRDFLDNTFEGLRIPNWESCQPNKASHSHWLRTAVAVARIGPGSWMLGRRHSIEAVFARARRAIADCLIRIDRNGLKFTRMPQIAVPVVECQLRVDCLWAAESRWKRNRLPREANSLLLYWCFLLEL